MKIGSWFLVAVLTAGCGEKVADRAVAVDDEAACPSAPPIEVDLAAWKAALEAVPSGSTVAGEGLPAASPETAAAYDELLARLGLEPLPDRAAEVTPPEHGVMQLDSVEILESRLAGGEPTDWLIQVRFVNDAGAESLRVAALRPLPGRPGRWCPLGDELSHEKEPGEVPCLEQHPGPARDLDLVRLVAPDRDAIRVRDAGGWCGAGARRGDRFATALWGAEGGRLVRYFRGVTAEAWYRSPEPPTETRSGEIRLSESFPRTLTWIERVECHAGEDPGPAAGCVPLERTTTYRYSADRYVSPEGDPAPGYYVSGQKEGVDR